MLRIDFLMKMRVRYSTGCCGPVKIRKPCQINCPTISPAPTFSSVTVSDSVTTTSINTDNAVIGDLSVVTGEIDTSTVNNLTIDESLVRTQGYMVNSSFQAVIPSIIPVGSIIPWAELNTPGIGLLPGFVGGIMSLSGQTGYLNILISPVDNQSGILSIKILKNGLAPTNLLLSKDNITDPTTFNPIIPVYSTDTSIEVSMTVTNPQAITNYTTIVQSL